MNDSILSISFLLCFFYDSSVLLFITVSCSIERLCSSSIWCISNVVFLLLKEKKEEEKKHEKKEEENPEILLKVDMHCEACARKVARALKGFEGHFSLQTFSALKIYFLTCLSSEIMNTQKKIRKVLYYLLQDPFVLLIFMLLSFFYQINSPWLIWIWISHKK